jgi:ribonucleoside-triphosphate reductase
VTARVIDMPSTIVKRDGRLAVFNPEKIEAALAKCFASIGQQPGTPIHELTARVVNVVSASPAAPTVEGVQDVVEHALQAAGEYDAAKHYILYRAAHAQQRAARPVPDEVRDAYIESARYFPTPLQQFQFADKYSRFNDNLKRRETWVETIDRGVDFLHELSGGALGTEVYERVRRAILEMRVMPSMRLLAMAGPAARRNNAVLYNCAYLPVDGLDSFVEALLISMAGCGVGYSVERQYVEQFPRVRRQIGRHTYSHVVEDSAEGWGEALRRGLELWFGGYDVAFDYRQIRPAGAPLRIKGGRASGPEPLRFMLDFVRARILARQGSFLRPLDAHDIMCVVGGAAVSGGIRHTALISLFDLDDSEMLHCKDGDLSNNTQRWNANNSAVWRPGMTQEQVARFMLDMVASGRGEPGIFSREAAEATKPARRQSAAWGMNPCGEILLRPMQFCNLSAAVARPDDTYESLLEKVELAAIIGTIQSMATYFPGLRPQWKANCEEERLLGVDITGQQDSSAAQDAAWKEHLKQHVVEVNQAIAAALGINPSAATTCVKPSGNTSQLVDCASGLHARWAPYYIRNVRVSAHSPLFKVLRDAGAPMDPENGQTAETATTWVVHFPVKAPEGATTRKDLTAIQQCEFWLQNKRHWTEHNPSATVVYEPDEVLGLIKWVWEHRDVIGGLSFLPALDAQYDQMPYVEITAGEYERLAAAFPRIDFWKIYRYEEQDLTTAAQELACFAGACDWK